MHKPHIDDCFYGEDFSWKCNDCLKKQARWKLEEANDHYVYGRWHEARTASQIAQACMAVANGS